MSPQDDPEGIEIELGVDWQEAASGVDAIARAAARATSPVDNLTQSTSRLNATVEQMRRAASSQVTPALPPAPSLPNLERKEQEQPVFIPPFQPFSIPVPEPPGAREQAQTSVVAPARVSRDVQETTPHLDFRSAVRGLDGLTRASDRLSQAAANAARDVRTLAGAVTRHRVRPEEQESPAQQAVKRVPRPSVDQKADRQKQQEQMGYWTGLRRYEQQQERERQRQQRENEKLFNRSTRQFQQESRLPIGPSQRREQALANLQRAERMGSRSQQFDARRLYEQADQAFRRASRETQTPFLSRLETFMRSSRYDLHGGIQPLLGRTLDLAGLDKLSGEAGLASAGLIALVAATEEASKSLAEFSQARFTGGGSVGETAQLRATGGALGLSVSQAAELSRQVSARAAGGGFGTVYGMRAGIYDLPGPLGNVDKARNLTKLADYLAGLPLEEAERQARELGAEQLLAYRNLEQHTRNLLKWDASITSAVFGNQHLRDATQLQANMQRLGDGMENLMVSAVNPLIDPLSRLASIVANLAEAAAGLTEKFHIGIHWSDVLYPFTTLPRMIMDNISAAITGKPGSRQLDEAAGNTINGLTSNLDAASQAATSPSVPTAARNPQQQKLIESIDELTMAMNTHTRVIRGGGERAQQALGKNAEYRILDQGLRQGGFRFGAF